MAGRRLVGICAAVLIIGFAGCGKKAATQVGGDSSPPVVVAPGPEPGSTPVGAKGKKETPKPDFDILLSEMKLTAGKPKTDVRPSGQTVLARLTDTFPPTHERRAEVYAALTETAAKLSATDRPQYVYWAARYAGKENVADLLDIARLYATDVKTSATSQAAFTRLAELKEPSTFPAIAAMLGDKVGLLCTGVGQTLRAIGSPAEKAVSLRRPDRAGREGERIRPPYGGGKSSGDRHGGQLPLLHSLFRQGPTVPTWQEAAAAIHREVTNYNVPPTSPPIHAHLAVSRHLPLPASHREAPRSQ